MWHTGRSERTCRLPACLYLIWSKSVQKWWSYCHLNDFKMAAAAMVVSWIVWILTVNLSTGPHFQPLVQIRSIMAELWTKMWFSIWRPPPSWILSDTSCEGKRCPGNLFFVSVSNLVRIRSKLAELLPFNWFQNGGRRHLFRYLFLARDSIYGIARNMPSPDRPSVCIVCLSVTRVDHSKPVEVRIM